MLLDPNVKKFLRILLHNSLIFPILPTVTLSILPKAEFFTVALFQHKANSFTCLWQYFIARCGDAHPYSHALAYTVERYFTLLVVNLTRQWHSS